MIEFNSNTLSQELTESRARVDAANAALPTMEQSNTEIRQDRVDFYREILAPSPSLMLSFNVLLILTSCYLATGIWKNLFRKG